jgi:hypothetical protein
MKLSMTEKKTLKVPKKQSSAPESKSEGAAAATNPAPESGGRDGPGPTRYGDWEINGRCVDF